jgi:hypothetical protein
VLIPVDANFNIDYSQLKYSYNILPDGITCTTDGRIYGKVESRPSPNDGTQFISKITVSYLNTVVAELSIVWDCQDIYIDEPEPTPDHETTACMICGDLMCMNCKEHKTLHNCAFCAKPVCFDCREKQENDEHIVKDCENVTPCSICRKLMCSNLQPCINDHIVLNYCNECNEPICLECYDSHKKDKHFHLSEYCQYKDGDYVCTDKALKNDHCIDCGIGYCGPHFTGQMSMCHNCSTADSYKFVCNSCLPEHKCKSLNNN